MGQIVSCYAYFTTINKIFFKVYPHVKVNEFLTSHWAVVSEDWLFNEVMLYWLFGDLEKRFIG